MDKNFVVIKKKHLAVKLGVEVGDGFELQAPAVIERATKTVRGRDINGNTQRLRLADLSFITGHFRIEE